MPMDSTHSQRKLEPSKRLPNRRTQLSSRPTSDVSCTMAVFCLTCPLVYLPYTGCWDRICAGVGPLSSREHSPDPSSFLTQQRCWSTTTPNWTWLLPVIRLHIGSMPCYHTRCRTGKRGQVHLLLGHCRLQDERSSGMHLRCQEVSLVYFLPTTYVTHRSQAIANPLL